jgi:hypothetical protein
MHGQSWKFRKMRIRAIYISKCMHKTRYLVLSVQLETIEKHRQLGLSGYGAPRDDFVGVPPFHTPSCTGDYTLCFNYYCCL